MFKLFPFQEKLLKKIEDNQYVNIPIGYGKSYIVLEYARKHPEQTIIIVTSAALLQHYKHIMKDMQLTNVKFIT